MSSITKRHVPTSHLLGEYLTFVPTPQQVDRFKADMLKEFEQKGAAAEFGSFLADLEANTIPGMTEASLLPEAAAAAGINYVDLCARIIALSRARAERSRR